MLSRFRISVLSRFGSFARPAHMESRFAHSYFQFSFARRVPVSLHTHTLRHFHFHLPLPMTTPERVTSGEKDACLARGGGEGRSSLCCDDVTPSGSGSEGNHPSPAAQGEPTAIMTFSTQCSESRCGGARRAPSPGASPQLPPPCGLRRRDGADPAWERADWSVSLLLSQPLNLPLRVMGKLTDPLRNRTPPDATATSLATRADSGEPPEATALAGRESSES